MNPPFFPSPAAADKAGFSLIEIMVVVVIIGILASIGVPKMVGHTQTVKIQKTNANIAVVMTGVRLYEMEYGTFPEKLQILVEDKGPNEPGPFLEDEELPKDGWERDFKFFLKGKRAKIQSAGPDGTFDTDDDILNR